MQGRIRDMIPFFLVDWRKWNPLLEYLDVDDMLQIIGVVVEREIVRCII